MNESESVIARRRLHWAVVVVPVIGLVLPALPFVLQLWVVDRYLRPFLSFPISWFSPLLALPALAYLVVATMAQRKAEIALTSKRVSFSTGVLFRVTGDLPLSKIETVFMSESVLGRLFGYGTVTVVGIGGTPVQLRYLPAPKEFHEVIKNSLDFAERASTAAAGHAKRAVPDESRYMPKV